MSDPQKKVSFAPFLNFVGGISGLVSLCAIVFYGGAMVEKVRAIDVRVADLESKGTSSLREHLKEDNTRDSQLDNRLAKVESALLSIPTITADIREIKVKLDYISKDLIR